MTKQIGVRIPDDLAEQLEKATDRHRDPLAPTTTQVVALGIKLALADIAGRKVRK